MPTDDLTVSYNEADVLQILEQVKINPSGMVENETIEFKEYKTESALHNDSNLAEEICALANLKGGVLVVGVRDDSNLGAEKKWPSQLVGAPKIDRIRAKSRIQGRLRNCSELRLETISFEGKPFLAIFIEKNISKLVGTTSGKTCIRDGRSSRPMDPQEIEIAVKSLHTFDWSGDVVRGANLDDFCSVSTDGALNFYKIFSKIKEPLSVEAFLESVGATKDGHVTRAGLIFLGKPESISKYLGSYEFRYTWKQGLKLKINDVWGVNLWLSIIKAKSCFDKCVTEWNLEYEGNNYLIPNLDPDAFHEAFLNAITHRDYTIDGMISVEYDGKTLCVNSPGTFYGGVTPENIFVHQPRHRNKELAKLLKYFGFVDRAGMGVVRMGVRSLIYGREFPVFTESNSEVTVKMQTEFIRSGIFVITRDKELWLPDLFLLNFLYEIGTIPISEAIEGISRISDRPWDDILAFLERWSLFIEITGSKNDVYLMVKASAQNLFKVKANKKISLASVKYIKLFHLLMKVGNASNEDITKLLGHAHSSHTSNFLRKTGWVENVGQAKNSRWFLSPPYRRRT